jgi:hypothetical protein
MKRKFLLPVLAFTAVIALLSGCSTDIDSGTTEDAALSLNSSVLTISGAVATVTQSTLTASLTGSSSTVEWVSTDSSIISLTNDGSMTTTLTAMGAGSARVVASTADGKLSASCTVTVTLSATAAHPVKNLAVSETTATSATLTWTDSYDLTAVKIICIKTSDSTQVSTKTIEKGVQTATITGLTTDAIGINYTFYVYGVVNSNNVSSVATVTADTLPDTTPPEEVTGLEVSAYTDHSITLTWIDPADDDFDHVVVSSTGTLQDGTTVISAVKVASGIQTVKFSKLAANTSYVFKVQTIDVNSNSSAGTSSDSTTTSVDSTAPSAVSGISATADSITSITLNWTDPSDADFTQVVISAVSSTSGVDAPSDVTVLAGVETAIITVNAGGNYTFTLKTEDYDGNSNTGVSVTGSTEPLASNVSGTTAYNGESVKITWADATAVESGVTYTYEVTAEKSDGTSVGSVESIAIGTEEAVFTGLTSGTAYTFTVITVADGTTTYSADSTIITFTPSSLNAVVLTNQNNSFYLLPNTSTSIVLSSSTSSSNYSDVWVVRSALDSSSTITYSGESTTGTVSTFSLEATDLNGIPTGEYLYLPSISSSNTSWVTVSAALGSASTIKSLDSTLGSFFLGSVSYSSGNYTKCIRLTNSSGYFMLGSNSTTSGTSLYYRYSAGLPGVGQAHWYYNQVSTAD